MRVFGVVALTVAALIVVPALVYVAYLHYAPDLRLDMDPDPAGLKRWLALIVAGLGACVGAVGGLALLVRTHKDSPPH
ncbi:MAG TPA: hypothetical protein VFV94_09590 [Polyangiaceae bacterium]|nr:hypothetical protein [Polyangiaceae bacterium]